MYFLSVINIFVFVNIFSGGRLRRRNSETDDQINTENVPHFSSVFPNMLEFIEFKFPKINVWIVVFVMMVSILTDFVIEILQLLTNGYNSTYQ